ncbi:hypothetical protein SDC9_207520 [bioreactor metagenome]|uniref:Uncharacterized protein n=1 Tax=bioreactor metagenome TaxID=1076179 RepID=A0A645J804_9ZZZZ
MVQPSDVRPADQVEQRAGGDRFLVDDSVDVDGAFQAHVEVVENDGEHAPRSCKL